MIFVRKVFEMIVSLLRMIKLGFTLFKTHKYKEVRLLKKIKTELYHKSVRQTTR